MSQEVYVFVNHSSGDIKVFNTQTGAREHAGKTPFGERFSIYRRFVIIDK